MHGVLFSRLSSIAFALPPPRLARFPLPSSVKTKLMNQKGIGAEREFKTPLDTFMKLFRREGIKGLYRGW